MRKADRLSRRPDWKIGVDRDNKNQVFIKDNWICSLQEVVIEGLEVEILEKIKKARSKDEEVVRIVVEIKKVGVKVIQGELVLKKGKVYVPKDEKLRTEIIQLHYDVLMAGHRGK